MSYVDTPSFSHDDRESSGPSALARLHMTKGFSSVSFLLSPSSCPVCSGANSFVWEIQLSENDHVFCKPKY